MFIRFFTLILGFLSFGVATAHATNYYVSPQGNDYLSGTSQQSAWATVSRVNCASLRSGDQVYFLRGGIWRETLQPQASGLYYGAYGTGNRPVISGADLLGNNFLGWWLPLGSNIWFVPVDSTPTQMWFNGVLGTQVASSSGVLAPLHWYTGQIFGQNFILAYSNGNPSQVYSSPGIEATQRTQALLVKNVSGITAEHIAFVNSGGVNICLCAGTSGVSNFNDDVVTGALNEGVSIISGSASLTASEVINNGVGMNVKGGPGVTLNGSLVNGNNNQALLIASTSGASFINSSTISGNATNNPGVGVITNTSAYPLIASNSVLLPNPFEPKIFNFTGLTDAGNNAYQSPLQKRRSAPLVVVPFIDDYINLGVAQAVSQVARNYGCNLSYAINTKLVTTQAWAQIAQMQSAGVEIVAHTRSHSDLANNNVFSIQYTGTATKATMTIDQTNGLLLTYLNGSTTPDLSLSISDTYNGVIDVFGKIPAGKPYQIVIQPNQNYFTPINLASVSQVNIKTAPYVAQAGAGYLTWEIEGAKADIAANLPSYKLNAFATPFTSSNAGVENHIRDAGFVSNRNGLLTSASLPNGNWLLSSPLNVYNMSAEWLPVDYDSAKPASSLGALVEGLGAAGGVMAVYSHGYDEFSLQDWTNLFATLKQVGGTCMTMSQANTYIETQGKLIPDGTAKNWIQAISLNPDYSVTNASPLQGAHNLQ